MQYLTRPPEASPPNRAELVSLGSNPDAVRAAALDARGPCRDLARAVSAFATLPAGAATPPTATIEELSVSYRYSSDDGWISTTATSCTTTAEADDAMELFERSMQAVGYAPSTRRGPTRSDPNTWSARFALPGSSFAGAALEYVLYESPCGVEFDVVITDQVREKGRPDRSGDWAKNAPLPAGGELVGIELQTFGFLDLDVRIAYVVEYADIDAASILQRAAALLPIGPYDLSESATSHRLKMHRCPSSSAQFKVAVSEPGPSRDPVATVFQLDYRPGTLN